MVGGEDTRGFHRRPPPGQRMRTRSRTHQQTCMHPPPWPRMACHLVGLASPWQRQGEMAMRRSDWAWKGAIARTHTRMFGVWAWRTQVELRALFCRLVMLRCMCLCFPGWAWRLHGNGQGRWRCLVRIGHGRELSFVHKHVWFGC